MSSEIASDFWLTFQHFACTIHLQYSTINEPLVLTESVPTNRYTETVVKMVV